MDTIPTMAPEELHIEMKRIDRNFQSCIDGWQYKYNQNAGCFAKILGGAVKKPKSPSKEKHSLGEDEYDEKTMCLKCGMATENVNPCMFYACGPNNYQMTSVCMVCKCKKATFINGNKLPKKIRDKNPYKKKA